MSRGRTTRPRLRLDSYVAKTSSPFRIRALQCIELIRDGLELLAIEAVALPQERIGEELLLLEVGQSHLVRLTD